MYSSNRFSCDIRLQYDVPADSQFILAIQAARTSRQFVDDESMSFAGGVFLREDTDVFTGTRRSCFAVSRGTFEVQYRSVVTLYPKWISAEADARQAHHSGALEPLLPEAFRYLMPSRYCPSDLLLRFVCENFDLKLSPAARAQSIVDWVQRSITFKMGSSSAQTTAMETLQQRVGVCRDFAHLAIALCRAANLPARYVTGFDYGCPVGDPDFHAYIEVLIDAEWRIYDPTGLCIRPGLMRIATGLDASNTAFGTIFGPATMRPMKVAMVSLDLDETALRRLDTGVHAMSTSGYNDLADGVLRRFNTIDGRSARPRAMTTPETIGLGKVQPIAA